MKTTKITDAKRVKKMKFNNKKFSNLVHYICYRCDDKSKLGATKLNKILWYADLNYYLHFGKSITGETYIKRQFGPVPSHILATIDELVWDEKLIIRDIEYFGRNKKEYISLTKPDISNFNSEEISLVDSIISTICLNYTAESISRSTHDRIWELAEIGEEIPYYTVFSSTLGEIDEEDIKWAKERLNKKAA